MTEIDENTFNRLFEWDERVAKGDHSWDEWAISVLKSDLTHMDDPLIFSIPRSGAAVQVAIEAGVDFLQRKSDGETVLFEHDLYDTDTYRRVADIFAEAGTIDWAEEEGLTALSVQVKFGMIENARALLERGASVDSYATIARYGGSRLTIPTQAVIVFPRGKEESPESLAIKLLCLLKEFGLKLSAEEKSEVLENAQSKPLVKSWIEEHL